VPHLLWLHLLHPAVIKDVPLVVVYRHLGRHLDKGGVVAAFHTASVVADSVAVVQGLLLEEHPVPVAQRVA
jgi:hypothetical protein